MIAVPITVVLFRTASARKSPSSVAALFLVVPSLKGRVRDSAAYNGTWAAARHP
jgi:hypothetical protein